MSPPVFLFNKNLPKPELVPNPSAIKFPRQASSNSPFSQKDLLPPSLSLSLSLSFLFSSLLSRTRQRAARIGELPPGGTGVGPAFSPGGVPREAQASKNTAARQRRICGYG